MEAKATADCSAVTTAQFILENIILRHGPPEVIHTDQGTNFKPGDLVLITNEGNHPGSSKKLEPKFIGPMQVVEANEQTCIVESDEKSYHKAVHKSRLRRYHVSNSEGGQSAPSPASTLSQQPNMSQQRRPRKSSTTVAKQKQQRTTTAVTQPHHTTRYGRVSKPVVRFTSNTASLVVDQQS